MKKVFKLPYLPIFLAPLLLFASLLFTGKALFWGTPALQFVPWWDWAWETLRDGNLPLWNPLVGMGAPLLANYQSALFYPPHWVLGLLHWVGGAPLMAWGMTILVWAHLVWAGVGMAYVVRDLGGGKLAQTVGGLSFSLSGYLVARAGFLSINAAAAWLPWVLYFGKRGTRNQSLDSILKLGVVIAFQLLAGHAQITYYTLLLNGMWMGYWAWQREKRSLFQRLKAVLLSWGQYALVGVLAALLAAVQLLPTLEYLYESQRASALDFDFAMTYSFWPWRFLTLLTPDLFGNPAQGNYWGYGNFWEDAIYVGLLPFLLAAFLIFKTSVKKIAGRNNEPLEKRKYPSSLPYFMMAVIGISFLFALGKNTPVFPWLYKHVPSFNLFQAPARFTLWVIFSLSLLAGLGVDRWKRPQGRGLYWTRLATAGAFAISVGAGLASLVIPSARVTFIRATAMAGLWGMGTGILSLLAPQNKGGEGSIPFWRWGVALWVGLDLLVAGWGLNPGVDMNFYQTGTKTPERDGRLYLPPETEYEVKFNQFFRFDTFHPEHRWENLRNTSLPNLNMLDDQPMVNNFDPLVPGRYKTWMAEIADGGPDNSNHLLSVMGVNNVGVYRGEGKVIYLPLGEAENTVRWIPCSHVVSSPQEALQIVVHEKVNMEENVILERQPGLDQDCKTNSSGSIEDLGIPDPGLDIYRVESKQPGWVLRSNVWYPGWKATVGGEEVEIYRADYLFQGIHVPAGRHDVIFRYRPLSFLVGLVVSIVSSTAFGIVYIFRGRFSVGDKEGGEPIKAASR